MTLSEKLLAVMKDVKSLAKRGRNQEFGYPYVTEADTVKALRRALLKHGILVLPTVESVAQQGYLVMVNMTFTFQDVESGDSIVAKWAGAASDNRDKAIWKAITGAQKTFLLKTFLIPTYDDPERDSPSPSADAALKVEPEPLPVTIESVSTKGRTSTFALSDKRKVVCFDTRLVAIAEQRCQDRIAVLIRCQGEYRGKQKCVGIDDATPQVQNNPDVPKVAPEDVVF